MLRRAETAERGAVVVACGVFGLCLEASVLPFLTSIWEAMAAAENESDTNSDRVIINGYHEGKNTRLDAGICQLERTSVDNSNPLLQKK